MLRKPLLEVMAVEVTAVEATAVEVTAAVRISLLKVVTNLPPANRPLLRELATPSHQSPQAPSGLKSSPSRLLPGPPPTPPTQALLPPLLVLSKAQSSTSTSERMASPSLLPRSRPSPGIRSSSPCKLRYSCFLEPCFSSFSQSYAKNHTAR